MEASSIGRFESINTLRKKQQGGDHMYWILPLLKTRSRWQQQSLYVRRTTALRAEKHHWTRRGGEWTHTPISRAIEWTRGRQHKALGSLVQRGQVYSQQWVGDVTRGEEVTLLPQWDGAVHSGALLPCVESSRKSCHASDVKFSISYTRLDEENVLKKLIELHSFSRALTHALHRYLLLSTRYAFLDPCYIISCSISFANTRSRIHEGKKMNEHIAISLIFSVVRG